MTASLFGCHVWSLNRSGSLLPVSLDLARTERLVTLPGRLCWGELVTSDSVVHRTAAAVRASLRSCPRYFASSSYAEFENEFIQSPGTDSLEGICLANVAM